MGVIPYVSCAAMGKILALETVLSILHVYDAIP